MKRLKEPRRFLQVLIGPRQVGKTTLARQVALDLTIPVHYATADEPMLQDRAWLSQQWDIARALTRGNSRIRAALLVQRGLTESLAGRFEIIPASHWSYAEMKAAFGWSVDRFIYFGGYPGAAALIEDETRWRRYITSPQITFRRLPFGPCGLASVGRS